MPAARPVKIALDVVLARPEQLDRRAGQLFRDRRRLHHVIVDQPPAKAPAHPGEVDGDRVRRHAERLDDRAPSGLGQLGRRPEFERAVLVPERGAILRLHRGVRDEGIGIVGGDALGRARQPGGNVAVAPDVGAGPGREQ